MHESCTVYFCTLDVFLHPCSGFVHEHFLFFLRCNSAASLVAIVLVHEVIRLASTLPEAHVFIHVYIIFYYALLLIGIAGALRSLYVCYCY